MCVRHKIVLPCLVFPLEAAERILRCAAAETDAGDHDKTLRRPFGWLEIAREGKQN